VGKKKRPGKTSFSKCSEVLRERKMLIRIREKFNTEQERVQGKKGIKKPKGHGGLSTWKSLRSIRTFEKNRRDWGRRVKKCDGGGNYF